MGLIARNRRDKGEFVVSVPPSYQPPSGGGYYVPPPQNTGSNSAGCWKIGGITCGVLFLLSIIGGVVVTNMVFESPFGHQIKPMVDTTVQGIKIQQAVVDYHKKKHKYPITLSDLVPDYLPDRKSLHSDLDEVSKEPEHVSWQYIHPNEKTAGNAPLLKLDYTMSVPFSDKPKVKTSLVINLDGTTTQPAGSGGPTFGSSSGSLRQGGGMGTR
jgi:hypothetical protein